MKSYYIQVNHKGDLYFIDLYDQLNLIDDEFAGEMIGPEFYSSEEIALKKIDSISKDQGIPKSDFSLHIKMKEDF